MIWALSLLNNLHHLFTVDSTLKYLLSMGTLPFSASLDFNSSIVILLELFILNSTLLVYLALIHNNSLLCIPLSRAFDLPSFIKQQVPHDLQSPPLASEYHKLKINFRVKRFHHYRLKRFFMRKTLRCCVITFMSVSMFYISCLIVWSVKYRTVMSPLVVARNQSSL